MSSSEDGGGKAEPKEPKKMKDLSEEIAEENSARPARPIMTAIGQINDAVKEKAKEANGLRKEASDAVNDFMAKALGFEKENEDAKAIRKGMDKDNGGFTQEEKMKLFKDALQGNMDTTGMSPDRAAAAGKIQEAANYVKASGGLSEAQMAFAETQTDMGQQLGASYQGVKDAVKAIFGFGPAVATGADNTAQPNAPGVDAEQAAAAGGASGSNPGQETEAGVSKDVDEAVAAADGVATAATPEQFGKLAESVSSSDKVAASTSTTEKKNPVDNTKAATADGAQTTAKTVKKRPKSENPFKLENSIVKNLVEAIKLLAATILSAIKMIPSPFATLSMVGDALEKVAQDPKNAKEHLLQTVMEVVNDLEHEPFLPSGVGGMVVQKLSDAAGFEVDNDVVNDEDKKKTTADVGDKNSRKAAEKMNL